MLTPQEIKDYDIDSKVKFCFDYILPISKDRVLATHGGQISLITKTGEMICTYDSIEVPTYDLFSETGSIREHSDECDEPVEPDVATEEYVDEYLIILSNGYLGLIDYDGVVILEPEYSILKFNGSESLEVLKTK